MADDSSRDIRQQLYGIAECSVCYDTFKEPRTLPCQHTYCKQCIQRVIESSTSDDRAPCPMCREEFTIPQNGVDGLPKNIFIEQLKDVAHLHSTSVNCDACSGVATTSAGKLAIKYCAECQQQFCKACADSHPQIRATSDHKLFEIGDSVTGREAAAKMHGAAAIAYCEQHQKKALEFYCFECDAVACATCFVKHHHDKSHRCGDVNEVADKFRGYMTSDACQLGQTDERCRALLAELAEGKTEFIARADVVEQEVERRAEQLRQMIDDERRALLAELASSVRDRVKRIEGVVSDIEEHRSSVENLLRHTKELGISGTAVAIAQQHTILHRRAGELMQLDNVDRALVELGCFGVSLAVTNLQSENCLLGKITKKKRSGNVKFD